MLSAFRFAQTPAIHFGLGKIKTLPDVVAGYGKEVLIVTGASSFTKTRQWGMLQERLQNAAIAFHHYTVDREPDPAIIDGAVRTFSDLPIHVVVAIGGGSVLDAGKAIAAMWGKADSVKNYLEGVGDQQPDGATLPLIAVPTTAGTGSEATKNAVISEVGPTGFKKSLRHDNYVPCVALLDPELTLNVPPELTARSGMDAFTQLLEAYLSTNAGAMTDMMAWEGLRYLKKSLLRAYREGRDMDARSDMAYAALLSGLALANAGLGTVHGFASSIGGRFDIPHGVICGTLMAGVNRITLTRLSKEEVAYEKYVRVGALFSGLTGKSREYYAHFFVDLIEEWTEILHIPRLGAYGLQPEDLPAIAQQTSNKYNPVVLTPQELQSVLEKRL